MKSIIIEVFLFIGTYLIQDTKDNQRKSILLATGYDANVHRLKLSHATVFKLNEPSTCSLPPLPKAFIGGTGGVVEDKIILCGGWDENDHKSSKCYIYDGHAESWSTTEMSSRRYAAASVPMNNALWVTGGNQYGSSTSDLVYPDGNVKQGPSLPSSMSSHCMVKLENDDIMFVKTDGIVYIYNQLNNQFSKGPSGGNSHYAPTCVLFRSPAHGNRPIVLRVGLNGGEQAEIFDYTVASKWERIPNLPTSILDAQAVVKPDGKGAIVQYRDKLYELECSKECQWTVMPQTPPKSVTSAIMMYLPPKLSCLS